MWSQFQVIVKIRHRVVVTVGTVPPVVTTSSIGYKKHTLFVN
jgi:hypothetical protein